MQRVVAIVTLIFFVAVGAVLVAGAWVVVFPAADSATSAPCPEPCNVPKAPDIPAPPTVTTDTAAFSQQVTAYQHQAGAYKERVAAYEKYLAAWKEQRAKGPDRQARFQAILKDALLPILNPLVAAFIAYAFVKGTANVVQNVMAARTPTAPLQEFKLL